MSSQSGADNIADDTEYAERAEAIEVEAQRPAHPVSAPELPQWIERLIDAFDEIGQAVEHHTPCSAEEAAVPDRDIYPLRLPLTSGLPIERIADGLVRGLNSLYGVVTPSRRGGLSPCQLKVRALLEDKVDTFLSRLSRASEVKFDGN